MKIIICLAISFLGCRITGIDYFQLYTFTLAAIDIYEGLRKHTDEKCALHKSTSESPNLYLESNIPSEEITISIKEHRNL